MKSRWSDNNSKRQLVDEALQVHRAGRRWLFAAVILGAVSLVLLSLSSRHRKEPPTVPTAGLDPAVARVIEDGMARVRAEPHSSEAWGRLGSILMHYEFMTESATSFVEAEQRAPDDARWPYLHALLLMNHNPDSALNLLRQAAERAPATNEVPQIRLAQFLAERGRPGEAEKEYRRLLQRTPQHAAACLGLARLLHQQGRSAEGISLLQPALEDQRTRKSASELLATIEGSMGRTMESQRAARTASALPMDLPWPDPYWDEATRFRVGLKFSLEQANALLDANHASEAVALLQATTRDYPAEPEGWYLLGWALNQERAFPEAERTLKEYLRRSADSPKGLAQLGVALLAQKRFGEAMDVLEAALKLKPTWREVHANLGYACVQLNRAAEAELHYRHALQLDPNHLASHLALAELLLRKGDGAAARQVLQQAVNLAPSDSRVQALMDKAR